MRYGNLGSLLVAAVLLGPISAVFAAPESEGEVNVYSHRHYDVDLELYRSFEEQTGIKVNLVEGGSDELIERLMREGAESPADILMTVDAGRLHRAKQAGLLQPVSSPVLRERVPAELRDPEGYWYGLTRRARVIVYHPDRVDPSELSTYEALTDPEWRGRILIRSSSNIYNQSLLASMVANHGEDYARQWAAGIVSNMARTPKGNDRGQMSAVAAGEGDIAVVNTYYVGRMLSSSNPEERAVGEQMRVFFPNQDGRGAHVNVSGAGRHRQRQESVRGAEPAGVPRGRDGATGMGARQLRVPREPQRAARAAAGVMGRAQGRCPWPAPARRAQHRRGHDLRPGRLALTDLR